MMEPKFITVELIVEDFCNPSNQEALEYCSQMICEVFGKEENREHPRLKLLHIKVNYKYEP